MYLVYIMGGLKKQAYGSVNNLVNRCTLQWAEGL